MNDTDWLSGALAAREPHIDDDGFTDAVLARLPEASAEPVRSYDGIIIGSAALASAVVALNFPFSPFLDLITSSASVPMVGATLMLGLMTVSLVSDRLKQFI